MTIQCPHCNSDDVIKLSFDSNDFVCNDCGEDFQADNGVNIVNGDEDNDDEGGASFINLDPKVALDIAKNLRNENQTPR